MQINHWILLLVLTLSFSQWALSESKGFPIEGSGCQAMIHQKGIPTGNNNYKGKDCTTKSTIETQKVILIQNNHRTIASENENLVVIETEEKGTVQEVESTDDSSEYDYGAED